MNARLLALLLMSTALTAPFAWAAEKENELYDAVQFQDALKVKALLDKGANANAMADGRPLLGWAAQNGNVEIVDSLLKAGANPNVADEGIGHTPLMRAIETQKPGVILSLLKAKADPNAKAPNGKNCLMMAVESRKPKVVQALIVAGADVKYVTPEGDSPVLMAAQDGMEESYEIIRILGKGGADMNASNLVYTPLIYAIEQSNAKLVTTILEAGADPNAPNQQGRTPLSSASSNREIFEMLLKAKADPNRKSGSGDTPLAEAIYNDQIDLVKLLLAAGADTKQAGPNGTSALDYAKLHYRTEMIALLEPQPPAGTSDLKCTMVDAARIHMILHGSLEEQVKAGKMDSNIFRTYGDDTKEYGDMLMRDPSEACQLFERLAVKYGVESPYAKLKANPQ